MWNIGGLDFQRDRMANGLGRRFRLRNGARKRAPIAANAVSVEQWTCTPFTQHCAPCRSERCVDLGAARMRCGRGLRFLQSLFAQGAIVGQGAHCARAAERAGEQRIAGLIENLDATVGRQRIGPHEHRLERILFEVLELWQITFKECRPSRSHRHHDAIDE
jgi:hypothetical protein